MPNWVQNNLKLNASDEEMQNILEAIRDDEKGIGSIDFNKITPMPESLKIESGSNTDKGLRMVKAFLESLPEDIANQEGFYDEIIEYLHDRGKDVLFRPSPWEECSGIADESGDSFLWADAHAAGDSARTGYYAVLHAAGELAAKGVAASCVSVRVLFPPEAEEEDLKAVAAGIEEACDRMGLQVTAFQGETSCAAERIIVFAAAAGTTGRIGIRKPAAGQEIVFCGYAGLEGMLRILDEAGDAVRDGADDMADEVKEGMEDIKK